MVPEPPIPDGTTVPYWLYRDNFNAVKVRALVVGFCLGGLVALGVYAVNKAFLSGDSAAQCAIPASVQTIDTICGSGEERYVDLNGERFYSQMDGVSVEEYCQ